MRRRLVSVAIVAAVLAGLFVVAPSVVMPSKAPQAQAHGDYGNGVVANGCSVPGSPSWRDNPAGVSFHDACDRHDICYGFQWGKFSCDWNFYRDMLAACARSGNSANCRNWAAVYHGTVSNFGWYYYYHWDKRVRVEVAVFR